MKMTWKQIFVRAFIWGLFFAPAALYVVLAKVSFGWSMVILVVVGFSSSIVGSLVAEKVAG
jgi:hypothetical protein